MRILLEIWTKTPREAQLIQQKLQNQEFKNVVPHIFLSIYWYECWVDEILQNSTQ